MYRKAILFSFAVLTLSEPAEAAKVIKILMKTSEGVNVTGRVKVKVYPSGEKDAYIVNEGNGFANIMLEKCDDSVVVTAEPTFVGISRKINDDVPDWLPCVEPEVVFNDFQIQKFTISVVNPTYRAVEFWRMTLGDEALAKQPMLANNLAEAFQNQEYGKISIIATELRQEARSAGKVEDANFLYGIAIDAASRGVLSAVNRTDLIDHALQYSAETNRFELSQDTQAAIEMYQTQTMQLSPTSRYLGRVDWPTMRSLPGGAEVHVPDIRLGPTGVQSFALERQFIAVTSP